MNCQDLHLETADNPSCNEQCQTEFTSMKNSHQSLNKSDASSSEISVSREQSEISQ